MGRGATGGRGAARARKRRPNDLRDRISTRGRPTRATLDVMGTKASAHADLYHGFAVVEQGSGTGVRKVARPFSLAGSTLGRAGTNLTRRALSRETAYPGLRELVRRTYDAIATGRAAADRRQRDDGGRRRTRRDPRDAAQGDPNGATTPSMSDRIDDDTVSDDGKAAAPQRTWWEHHESRGRAQAARAPRLIADSFRLVSEAGRRELLITSAPPAHDRLRPRRPALRRQATPGCRSRRRSDGRLGLGRPGTGRAHRRRCRPERCSGCPGRAEQDPGRARRPAGVRPGPERRHPDRSTRLRVARFLRPPDPGGHAGPVPVDPDRHRPRRHPRSRRRRDGHRHRTRRAPAPPVAARPARIHPALVRLDA